MSEQRLFYLTLCAMYDNKGELDTINFLEVSADCVLGWNAHLYDEMLKKGKVVLLSSFPSVSIKAIVSQRIISVKRGNIKPGSLEAALCKRLFGSASAFGGELKRYIHEPINLDNVVFYNSLGVPLEQGGTGIYLFNFFGSLKRDNENIGNILSQINYIDAQGTIANLSTCPLPWIQFIFARLAANDRFIKNIAIGLEDLPGSTDSSRLCAIPVKIREACIMSASQQAAQMLMQGNAKVTSWFAPRYTGAGAPQDIWTYTLTDAKYIPTDAEQVEVTNVVAPLVVPASVVAMKINGKINAPIQFQKELGYFVANITQLSAAITTLPSIGATARTESLCPRFEYTLHSIAPQAFTDMLVIPPFKAANSELKLDFHVQPCNKLVVPIAHEGSVTVNLTREQFQMCSVGDKIKSRLGRKAVVTTYYFEVTDATKAVAIDVVKNNLALVELKGSSENRVTVNVKLGKVGIYYDALKNANTILYKTDGDLFLRIYAKSSSSQSEIHIRGAFDKLSVGLTGFLEKDVPTNGKKHIYVDADINYLKIDKHISKWVVLHVKKGFVAQMIQRCRADAEKGIDREGSLKLFLAFEHGAGYYTAFSVSSIELLQAALHSGALIEDL